jgi:hypothetical protein
MGGQYHFLPYLHPQATEITIHFLLLLDAGSLGDLIGKILAPPITQPDTLPFGHD